jgi:HEAT repeat protein
MLKKIFVALVGIFTGILSTRLSGWITSDPRVPVLSLKQLFVTLGFYVLLLIVLWVLETQRAFTLNWPWHRFWYFHELLERAKFRRQPQTLAVADETQSTALIDVSVDGRRKNLGSLLLDRLSNHTQPRRLLILGEPGSGKTTTLEQLRLNLVRAGASRLAIGKGIPVLLPLGRFNQGKLLDYARKVMQQGSRASVNLSRGLEKLLQNDHAILLLDAIDESLGQNQNALEEIEGFLSNDEYLKAPVVITGRMGEYQRALPADMEVLEVMDLSDEAVTTLCHAHLAQAKRGQTDSEVFSALKTHALLGKGGLGRNPFWLQLILEGGTFENNKTKIFERSISALLNREWQKSGSKRLWTRALTKDEQLLHTSEALTSLAAELSRRNAGEQIDGEEALRIVEQYLSSQTRIGDLRPQDVLWLSRDAQLVDFDNLAGRNKWPPVRFRHRLIREYLTARGLSNDFVSVFRAFADHAGEVSWWETLLMLATLAQEKFSESERRKITTAAIGDAKDPYRLFFTATMLKPIDFLFDDPTVDSLIATLCAGVTEAHLEAVTALGQVATGKLVKLLNTLVEREDPALTEIVKSIIGQHLRREIKESNSSRVIAAYIGDVYLRDFAKPALISIGGPAALLVAEVLRDSEYAARWSAAEVLGEIGESSSVEPLIGVLENDDEKEIVRQTVIKALGQIGDVRALIPMARALKLEQGDLSGFVLNALIIDALGKIGEPAIDELIRMLKMDELTLKIFASVSLERIGKPAAKALIETLDDRSMWTRQSAAQMLGSMKAVEAINALIKLLTSGDLLVEQTAADALAEIGEPSLEPLIALLSDRNLELRVKAVDTLGRIGDSRAIDPLLRILAARPAERTDKGSELRAAAAEALGNFDDLRVRSLLFEVAAQEGGLVWINATASLAQLGDEDALKKVHSWLGNDNSSIQFVAIDSLGRIKHSRSLRYLERFLKVLQPAPEITREDRAEREKNRERALGSIRKILERIKRYLERFLKLVKPSPEATKEDRAEREKNREPALRSIKKIQAALLGLPELPAPKETEDDLAEEKKPEAEEEKPRDLTVYQQLLDHQNAQVRADVVMALTELGSESAQLITGALADSDTDVRREAATGLGTLGAAQAVQPLLDILQKDTKSVVRRAAAESLGKIGDRTALEPLRLALKDRKLIVRIGAAIGLGRMGEPGMGAELRSVLQANDSPAFRYLIVRAFAELRDVKAIPYLEEILERWQAEGIKPEDAQHFKAASEELEKLKTPV